MTRALVTGAGGFVGGAIARALIERGDAVRGFARGSYPELEALGVEMVQGDLVDKDAVARAAEGCDLVFHVAAFVSMWGAYEDFYAANVTGTENIIAACEKAGVKKLVFTSTPSVVHDAEGGVDGVDESAPYPERYASHYPATKAIAEQKVLAANSEKLSTVAIRPHMVWGPRDKSGILPNVVEKARGGKIRWPGKPQKVDTCYIDNCTQAHLRAADRLEPGAPCAGKAYFITQGEPVMSVQFANDLLKSAGAPLITKHMSVGVAKFGAAVVEGAWKTFGIKRDPPVTRFQVTQMVTPHWYNISAAREELGYAPEVSYDEGMRRLKAWLTDNPL